MVLDNTPVLPPFTSPFHCVIIFTIAKIEMRARLFVNRKCCALFACMEVYMALVKYCNHAGCSRLIPQGTKYCEAHTINQTRENSQRHREYDAHCRNKRAKAFYNSAAWRAARASVLARDNHIDVYLYIMEHRIVAADTVHHIVELSEDYSRRCDLDNLISISEATHSMISKAYKDDAKRAAMQKTLRECMEEYKRRLAG